MLAHPKRLSLVLGAVLLVSCGNEDESEEALAFFEASRQSPSSEQTPTVAPDAAFNPRLLRRFAPAQPHLSELDPARSEQRVSLGRMLFFEERISKAQTLSCNSCHPLARYGADSSPTSRGHNGHRGVRNSPTVYHAAAQFRQFWDGRSASVEEQAQGPILNPHEMAAPNEQYVVDVLTSMPAYEAAFSAAFPESRPAVTFSNIATALGAFERQLVTHSRWDRYLNGEREALSRSEVEGLKIFTNLGCMVCHTGELIGGSMYAKVGAVDPWPNQRDQGRFERTQNEEDRMMFKVPTLRNVAETAPYFHDGSAQSLSDAIRMMGTHQLGLELRDDQIEAIASWLKSLTGELPQDYIRPPKLPPSTPQTPEADPT